MAWLAAAALAALQGGRATELENKIQTMTVDVNFAETPFEEVITFLQEYSGVNILVDPAVYEIHPRESMKVTLKARGIRLQTALNLVLGEFDLGSMVKDNLLEITTKERLNYYVVTRIYDVRDLFVKVNNFPGPRLELLPGAGAGGASTGVFLFDDPVPPPIDEAQLDELIRLTCSAKSWDENPNASMQFTPNGMLMVAQTRKVHAEVEKLVNMLRELR
jgi:hypothetical protein